MKRIVLLLALWSVATVFMLLFLGPQIPLGGCGRLVGSVPGCAEEMQLLREQLASQFQPGLAAVTGYAVISAVAVLRFVRWARRR